MHPLRINPQPANQPVDTPSIEDARRRAALRAQQSIENPVTVKHISREQFVSEFDWSQGQHVTFIGPTQRGKTTLCFQLLAKVMADARRANSNLKCVVFATKPPKRDGLMESAPKALNLRVIETWPPEWSPRDKNRNGYVLKPHQSLTDLKGDKSRMHDQFSHALRSGFATGPNKPLILVVDEAHFIQNDLSLKEELEAPLMRGAPVVSVWGLIQRGRFMSYHFYGAPDHIFVFNDPDGSNRERYSDIGGVDPKQLVQILRGLKNAKGKNGNTISECVYIRRSDPETVWIVDVA